MKQIMKTINMTLAALALTMGGQAAADYNFCQPYDNGCFPDSWCINNGFIRGDLLVLEAFEDGLSSPCEPSAIVTLEDDSSSSGTFTRVKGHGKEPKYRWDLGFRIGAGMDFNDCNWAIAAYWMHFNPKATKHDCTRPRWKLDYDTVDVLVGYKCRFNSCFVIDAFGGLRAAKIDQHLHANFTNRSLDFTSDNSGFEALHSNKKVKQQFEGIGFIFGLKGEFQFSNGLTLFLIGDTGTLVGRNKIKPHSEFEIDSDNKFEFEYKRHERRAQYFVESNVGIRWATYFCDSMKLTLELGYESHNYFNHNRIYSDGNLYIHGVNLSAALQF